MKIIVDNLDVWYLKELKKVIINFPHTKVLIQITDC